MICKMHKNSIVYLLKYKNSTTLTNNINNDNMKLLKILKTKQDNN